MSDPRCGTPYGYSLHVKHRTPKCDACRRAHAVRAHTYSTRRYINRGAILVDATGTRRRLHALGAMGWSSGAIAARFGVAPAAVLQWTRRARVQPATAARVADLYDELWGVPGPSDKVRIYAHSQGWPPPLAWNDDEIDDPAAQPQTGSTVPSLDEVAVLRAMYGDPVRLRPSERAEATRRLTAAGLSAAQIAERLGCTKRSVVRQRNTGRDVA